MNFKKEVKSFEDSCKVLSIDPKVQPDVSMLPESDGKALIALFKLSKISEAAWKMTGKEIDWSDWDQYKYYPWFEMGSSGAGFSFGGYVCDDDGSDVGSRLVYPTREIAVYAGTQFIDLYRDLMVK